VAGFDHAIYGLDKTNVIPLLFEKNNIMVATSSFTTFKMARYGPDDSWKALWETILNWLKKSNDVKLSYWGSDPKPSYFKTGELPSDAQRISILRGSAWIFNARFLIHSDWQDIVFRYLKKDSNPYGPPVGNNKPNGDGSLGVLEGHA